MADSVVPDDATAAPCLFPPARARRLRSSSSSLSSLTLFVLLLLSLLLFAFTPLVLSAQEEAAAAAAPPRDGGKKGSGGGGLVRREGGRFVLDDGSTFYVAGANCYYLVYSHGAEDGSFEHQWVDEVLEEAESLSLNVIRTCGNNRTGAGATDWAFQDQWWERERALQPAPGVYNERFLVALDNLIVDASERGLKLLLCLTNYWEDYGGAISYVKWARDAGEGGTLDRRAGGPSIIHLALLYPRS